MNNKDIRNSIKIILLNDKNELLLINTDDASIKSAKGSYNGRFWHLIGGKIEHSETSQEAAERELFEETGLTTKDVIFGKEVWFGSFELIMKGKVTNVRQRFIVARTNKVEVTTKNLTEEEHPVTKNLKWFSLNEIKNTKDIIYPVVLRDYLGDVINGNLPEKPIEIDLGKKPN